MISDSLAKYLPEEASLFKCTPYRGAKIDKLRKLVYSNELDKRLSEASGVICLIGTNNLELDTPGDIVHGLLKFAQLIRAKFRHLSIHISTLIPRVDEKVLLAKIPVVNNKLREKAGDFGFEILDLEKTFVKGGCLRDRDHWAKDGLHLTSLGLKKVQQTINNYIHRYNRRS